MVRVAGASESCGRAVFTLAEGTFHVNAFLHRYLTDQRYDSLNSAATFFVTGAHEVRGVVTLHPRLTECRISGAESDAKSAFE